MDDAASEIARLRAALAASEARAASAEADLAQVRAVVTTSEAMIRHLKLEIAKMRREQYGQSSERRARLIDQMELQLEELEADATEDEIAAERVAAKITNVSAFERRPPARKPFPAHLPRERLIIEAPSTCTCCGSDRIVKMGEDVTETLEAIPPSGRWSRRFARSSPAGIARRSASHRHLSMPRRADGRGRTCSPRSCSRSSASISP